MPIYVRTNATISTISGGIPKNFPLSPSTSGPDFCQEGEDPLFLSSLMDNAHHRVNPLDVLVSSVSTMDPSKYQMLNNNQYSLRPPPHRRNIPRYHSHQSSGGNCCLRCICCCCCTFIVLIIFLAGLGFLLYVILQPQLPVYSISNFGVQAFDLQPDFSLYTEFAVAVKAENPNEKIGFIYGKDGSVVVSYQGSTLCSGKIPNFRQPGKNTSVLNIVLKGKSEFGNGLQEALMDNRNSGKIPLLVQVKAPLTVVIREFPLREVVALVNNSLVVDNLSPRKKAKILSSQITYGFEI